MAPTRKFAAMRLLLVFAVSYIATVTAAPSIFENEPGHNQVNLPGFETSYGPKRSGSKGFHEGIFDYGFGGFSTVKRGKRNVALTKRIPEMTAKGIGLSGDTFTGGFGNFYTMKRASLPIQEVDVQYYLSPEDYFHLLESLQQE